MQDAAQNSVHLPNNWLEITLAISVAVTLALAVSFFVARIARRLFGHLHTHDTITESMVRGTVRIIRLVSFGVALALFAFPALDLAGVNTNVGMHSRDLGAWAAETGVRIAVIVALAFLINRVIATVVDRLQRDLSTGAGIDAVERQRRAATVAGLLRGGLRTLIWTLAGLVVLRELDVDITPVLTGAGILGLAVGFGAQTLVRDIISGFFMIVEDQVRVGDVAQVNGTGGVVEQINLRTIVLRDLQGTVHVFPNGSISTLANLTKDFSFYVINMGVDYAEDTDRVVAAMNDVAEEMRKDPKYAPSMLEPLEVMGVDAFDASQVTVKVRLKCVPLKQWEVGREFNRRVKKEFDRREISIPFPQRTLHFATAPPAIAGPPGAAAPDDPNGPPAGEPADS
ncbi:MAG: mechanosensitive ion channel family protein [Vicinamibacterales bacterium]